jgi:hypothetical protein
VFAGYVILGFIIDGTYSKLSSHIVAFVVLYDLLQAFGHMGGPRGNHRLDQF